MELDSGILTAGSEALPVVNVESHRAAAEPIGRFRMFTTLLGKRVLVLLGLGLAVGLLLFAVELAFANCVQFLLVALDITPHSSLPGWAPLLSVPAVLSIVLAIGSAKALLQWAQAYLQAVSFEESRFLQRSRIVRWAIFSSGPNSGHVVTLYNDRVAAFSSIVQTVQTLAVTLTALLLIGISLFALTPWATAITVGVLGGVETEGRILAL